MSKNDDLEEKEGVVVARFNTLRAHRRVVVAATAAAAASPAEARGQEAET